MKLNRKIAISLTAVLLTTGLVSVKASATDSISSAKKYTAYNPVSSKKFTACKEFTAIKESLGDIEHKVDDIEHGSDAKKIEGGNDYTATVIPYTAFTALGVDDNDVTALKKYTALNGGQVEGGVTFTAYTAFMYQKVQDVLANDGNDITAAKK